MLGIVLSARLSRDGSGRDLDALSARLAATDARVRLADLTRAGEVARAATECGADRLVVVRAGPGDRAPSLQTEARSACIDPLGVVVVDLGDAPAAWGSGATERAALLVAGAAAKARAYGGSRPEHARAQFSVGMDRRAFLRMSAPEQRAVPSVPARCAAQQGCRRCREACPVEAISWYGERMHVDKRRCTSCGICASACPTGSIELPGWTEAEVEAQLAGLADRAIAGLSPRGPVFVCRSNAAALRRRAGGGDAPGWLPVEVPCVGMLTMSLLLRAVALGADAIGIVPCGAGCAPGQASVAQERIALCRDLLAAMGGDGDRIVVLSLESAAWDLVASTAAIRAPSLRAPDPRPARRAADAVLALAQAHGAPDVLDLADARSPLATVSIDSAACTGCLSCVDACPTGALGSDGERGAVAVSFDATLCGGCALCAPRCPESAIRVRQGIDLAALARGRVPIFRDSAPRCERCQEPIAPEAMLRRVAALLGEGDRGLATTLGRYCASCRVLAGARPAV